MSQGEQRRQTSEGPPAALALVEEELLSTEGFLLESVWSEFPFVTVMAQHLLRAGGKRLRVALTYLAAGFGRRDPSAAESIRKLAAAIELTHLATLHHDDVIDEADTRRGVPSVNANWTNTLAVLSGDYLFAKSSQLAAEVGGEAPGILASTIAALCEGQVREIECAFNVQRSMDEYLKVIELKTARLLSAATYLGARVGGTDDETAASLRDYATSFGIAFQVADDLLDFLGDEGRTGKPLGTDLKEGIYTLPLLHAIKEDDAVAEMLGSGGDLGRIVGAMQRTGSFTYSRDVARGYADQALKSLQPIADSPHRRALEDLVEFVLQRMPVSPAA
ncbi:MAG TPA: polyprenyl synthetase family protein [Actinomycetota bacterium]|nr:polyprenyl synthetase family protein [Actinomycetota bacterium]